ncbi:MAG: helix-turn-helix transcriptional regulator [Clostridiales bacterium]|nr:helix-turn-helix transcriptional regulator [Clostridiales bacterium]
MNKFKELRLNKNLTQEQLSKILKIGQSAISKWEKGRTIPDVPTLKIIAEFYDVSIEELLKNSEKTNINRIKNKDNNQLTPLQRKCMNYVINLNELYLEKAEAYLSALYHIQN